MKNSRNIITDSLTRVPNMADLGEIDVADREQLPCLSPKVGRGGAVGEGATSGRPFPLIRWHATMHFYSMRPREARPEGGRHECPTAAHEPASSALAGWQPRWPAPGPPPAAS